MREWVRLSRLMLIPWQMGKMCVTCGRFVRLKWLFFIYFLHFIISFFISIFIRRNSVSTIIINISYDQPPVLLPPSSPFAWMLAYMICKVINHYLIFNFSFASPRSLDSQLDECIKSWSVLFVFNSICTFGESRITAPTVESNFAS